MLSLTTSFYANAGGVSSKVAIGAASVQSAVLVGGTAVVTPDTTCFYRVGANPVAVADGTDQILLANNTYRISGVAGLKLAFISAGVGNVYITPEA